MVIEAAIGAGDPMVCLASCSSGHVCGKGYKPLKNTNVFDSGLSTELSTFAFHGDNNMQRLGGPGSTLRRLASCVRIATAIVLVAVKLTAWIATGSVALLTCNVSVRWSAWSRQRFAFDKWISCRLVS
jgi:hypothetical protein